MSKIKIDKKENFTQMDNHAIRNKDLSCRALGLMLFMWSLHPDWDFSVEGLTKVRKEGRDAIRAMLKELEEHGYLVRQKTRDRGRFSYDYNLIEVPKTEKPCTEKPCTEKPTQYNTTTSNTLIINTKNKDIGDSQDSPPPPKKKPKKKFVPPTVGDVRDYCNKKQYRHVNPENFVNFYGSKNWMVGKNKMSNWKLAVAGWEGRAKEETGGEVQNAEDVRVDEHGRKVDAYGNRIY